MGKKLFFPILTFQTQGAAYLWVWLIRQCLWNCCKVAKQSASYPKSPKSMQVLLLVLTCLSFGYPLALTQHWLARTCNDLHATCIQLVSCLPHHCKWEQVFDSENLHRLVMTCVSFGQGWNVELTSYVGCLWSHCLGHSLLVVGVNLQLRSTSIRIKLFRMLDWFHQLKTVIGSEFG